MKFFVTPYPLRCAEHDRLAASILDGERIAEMPSDHSPEDRANELVLRADLAIEKPRMEACAACRALYLRLRMSVPEVAMYLLDDDDVVDLSNDGLGHLKDPTIPN
jgi:iron-sulfur cluster repair protein YtfE (RIC family)